ncbi:MAG: type II secretion system protein [Pirellulales bacterium]|nr:type II secretion system protein [Pirellulales bacterium]
MNCAQAYYMRRSRGFTLVELLVVISWMIELRMNDFCDSGD